MNCSVHFNNNTFTSVVHPTPQLQTDQGIHNFSVDRAAVLAGSQPDYGITDLFEAIAKGDHVSSL